MVKFIKECKKAFKKLWKHTNHAVRGAFRIMILWPLLLLLVAFTGMGGLVVTPIVALLPFLAIIVFLWNSHHLLAIPAIAAIPWAGKKVVNWVTGILGVELGIGILLTLFPQYVAKDLKLFPLFLLCAATFGVFSIGSHGRVARLLQGGAGLVSLGIIVLWFFGGRAEAGEKLNGAKGWFASESHESFHSGSATVRKKVHQLRPNEWTEWENPGGPGSYVDFNWQTPDGTIEIGFRFDDGTEKVFVEKHGTPCTFHKDSLFFRGEPYQLRFRNSLGGKVTTETKSS